MALRVVIYLAATICIANGLKLHGLQEEPWEEPSPSHYLRPSRLASKEYGIFDDNVTSLNLARPGYNEAFVIANTIQGSHFKDFAIPGKFGMNLIRDYDVPGLAVVSLLKNHHNQCLLSITGLYGNDPIVTTLTNMGKGFESLCGYSVHKGAADMLRQVISHPDFKMMNNYLSSKQCSSVTLGGYSTGAMVTDILATCANSGMLSHVEETKPWPISLFTKSINPVNFEVDAIFTFGGPAVSLQAMKNAKSEDGCFKGIRFFTQRTLPGNSTEADYMTTGGLKFNMVHPRVMSAALDTTGYTKQYNCTDENTPNIPPYRDLTPEKLQTHWWDLHNLKRYMQVIRRWSAVPRDETMLRKLNGELPPWWEDHTDDVNEKQAKILAEQGFSDAWIADAQPTQTLNASLV